MLHDPLTQTQAAAMLQLKPKTAPSLPLRGHTHISWVRFLHIFVRELQEDCAEQQSGSLSFPLNTWTRFKEGEGADSGWVLVWMMWCFYIFFPHTFFPSFLPPFFPSLFTLFPCFPVFSFPWWGKKRKSRLRSGMKQRWSSTTFPLHLTDGRGPCKLSFSPGENLGFVTAETLQALNHGVYSSLHRIHLLNCMFILFRFSSSSFIVSTEPWTPVN